MKTEKPLKSVGWLGGSSHRMVINKTARAAAQKASRSQGKASGSSKAKHKR